MYKILPIVDFASNFNVQVLIIERGGRIFIFIYYRRKTQFIVPYNKLCRLI